MEHVGVRHDAHSGVDCRTMMRLQSNVPVGVHDCNSKNIIYPYGTFVFQLNLADLHVFNGLDFQE